MDNIDWTSAPSTSAAEQVVGTARGSGVSSGSSRYRVSASVLPLLQEPADSATVRAYIKRGQLVQGRAVPARGPWTAVSIDGLRGWIASSWLEQVDADDAAGH